MTATPQQQIDFLTAALQVAQQQVRRAQDAEINAVVPLRLELATLRARVTELEKGAAAP
jgi:hypothetical protein